MAPNQLRREEFERLVAIVHDPLFRYLGRRARADDCDEVMSEILLILWRRLEDVPLDDPLPWSYGIARRVLANHRRGGQRRLALVERLEAQPPTSYSQDAAEDYPELIGAIEMLSPTEREVIVLWAWEQLEPRDIAVILDTTPNAVSLRLTRAKKKLAENLARQDRSSAGHITDGDPGGKRT